tara:strand:+ start:380 stop:1111 length:732 start_codon:yes stop_codon:yes gene_type:complete
MNKEGKIYVNGNWWNSTHIAVPSDYMDHFDFIDLGAKTGKMRKYAQNNFNGTNGVHVDIEEDYINTMEEQNIPCIQADITNLSFPENSVDFVISTHTIEHLPDLNAVQGVIEMCAKSATEFVYLTWPSFDASHYLKDHNFTQFFSTMDGHTCHATQQDVRDILTKLNLDGVCSSWNRILDSNHTCIVPLNSPVDTGPYTDDLDQKPYMQFTEPVYYENVCLIKLNPSQKYYNAERFIKSFCPW